MSDELRSAENKVSITGVVLEHKLKEQKGEDGKYINGSLVIKAGKFTEIELKVYVTQFTKEKKEKKNYTLLKQIVDGELPTLVTDKENAVVLSVYGNKDFQPQLREERYANQTKTEVVTRISVDLGFGTLKVVDVEEEDYKATFDIEMFVTSIDEEIEKDSEEETGRVKIKGYVPTYGGGIFPIEVIAGKIVDEEGEFDFAEDVRSEIEEGSTINVWGNINFAKIIEKKSKGGKLGRAKVEDKATYIHELIAIGADFIEDDAYEEEDIEKAVKERKIQLDEVLTKAKQKEEAENSKGKGISKSSKSTSSNEETKDKTKRKINF